MDITQIYMEVLIMKLNFKGYIIIVVFLIFSILSMFLKFVQIEGETLYLGEIISRTGDISSFIIYSVVFSGSFFIFFSYLLHLDYTYKTVNSNKSAFGLVYIFVFLVCFSQFGLQIIITKNITLLTIIQYISIGLTSLCFLFLGLSFLGIIKERYIYYYFMFSPILLFLIRIVRTFSSDTTTIEITDIWFETIYLCCMALFLNGSARVLTGCDLKVNRTSLFFYGIFGGFLGLVGTIPRYISSIFFGTENIYIDDMIHISDFAISIYALFFTFVILKSYKFGEEQVPVMEPIIQLPI